MAAREVSGAFDLMGAWTDWNWPEQAFAAISEGFCPNGHGLLKPDAGGAMFTSYDELTVTRFESGGWCFPCRIWWHVEMREDELHVVASYALADYAQA